MSLSVEYDKASTCELALITGDEAAEDLPADEEFDEYVLVIGGGTGGCFAVEGKRDEIAAFAERVLAATRA